VRCFPPASAEQAYPSIFHEFAHLLLRGVFDDAPLWFSEGLAEYYSTFQVTNDGRRANIGQPVGENLVRRRERRLPFARFFAIDRNSPEYTTNVRSVPASSACMSSSSRSSARGMAWHSSFARRVRFCERVHRVCRRWNSSRTASWRRRR
jgi:hypothetical protein